MEKLKKIKVTKCKSQEEAQAMANFLYNEILRHVIDIREAIQDLRLLREKWKVKPTIKKLRFVKP